MGAGSSAPSLYAPDEKSQRTFEILQLKKDEVEKLYASFTYVDRDGSGEISLREFFEFLEIKRTLFAEKSFSIMDEDQSGEIDFREFVIAIWNYCSFTKSALILFAFDLYDIDNSGTIGKDECHLICKEVYGSAFQDNTLALKVYDQLTDLAKKFHNDIEPGVFEEFCKKHPGVLFPAFVLQNKVMGQKFWKVIAKRREGSSTGGLSWRDLYDKINGDDEDVDDGELAMLEEEEALRAIEAQSPERRMHGTVAQRREAAAADQAAAEAAVNRERLAEVERMFLKRKERENRRAERKRKAKQRGEELTEAELNSSDDEDMSGGEGAGDGGGGGGDITMDMLEEEGGGGGGGDWGHGNISQHPPGALKYGPRRVSLRRASVELQAQQQLQEQLFYEQRRQQAQQRKKMGPGGLETVVERRRSGTGGRRTSTVAQQFGRGGGVEGLWDDDVPQRVMRRPHYVIPKSIKNAKDPHMELFL